MNTKDRFLEHQRACTVNYRDTGLPTEHHGLLRDGPSAGAFVEPDTGNPPLDGITDDLCGLARGDHDQHAVHWVRNFTHRTVGGICFDRLAVGGHVDGIERPSVFPQGSIYDVCKFLAVRDTPTNAK